MESYPTTELEYILDELKEDIRVFNDSCKWGAQDHTEQMFDLVCEEIETREDKGVMVMYIEKYGIDGHLCLYPENLHEAEIVWRYADKHDDVNVIWMYEK